MPFRKVTWDSDWARILYIAIVIVAAIAMAVLFIQISNDKKDINREANIRATQIQQQRYDTTYANCVDQNRRNLKTIKTLNNEINQLPASERLRAAQSKEFTILLVQALVPKRNCMAVARAAVHPLENPKGR